MVVENARPGPYVRTEVREAPWLKAAAVLNSNSPGRGGRLQRQWQQVWLQLLRFMLMG